MGFEVRIDSVHHCENGHVYVQLRDGFWYEVTAHGHEFAELRNWNAETWARARRDPPCRPPRMPR